MRLYGVLKNSTSFLLLGGAAVNRCDKWLTFIDGLKTAEKLGFGRFWEGHDFSRAVKSLKMCPRFSA